MSLAFALSGSFVVLAVASAIARLMTYLCVCAATIRLRHPRFRNTVAPAAFILPLGALVPLLAILTSLLMLVGASARQLLGEVPRSELAPRCSSSMAGSRAGTQHVGGCVGTLIRVVRARRSAPLSRA